MALVRPAAALIHAVAEHESIDQAVEFLRPLAIGAISKLGHSDRADAEIRWSLSLQARADLALAPEREAPLSVSRRYFMTGQNGSFCEPTVRAGGLGMSSVQAPRHLRNSAGHSSAGSRMTCFPRHLTITSSKPSLNRHDFGSRTAWLPPFWKIFARSAIVKVYMSIYLSSFDCSTGGYARRYCTNLPHARTAAKVAAVSV